MNRLGKAVSHSIVSLDGNFQASNRISSSVDFRLLPPPSKSMLARFDFMRLLFRDPVQLMLTYNWGSMDAVLAAAILRVGPVIHAEDGFHSDESVKRKLRRRWVRQMLLNNISVTVVPSRTLEQITRKEFLIHRPLVAYIPNGVDCQRFVQGPNADIRQHLTIPADSVVFGYVGHLRPEKNLGLLVDSFAEAALPNSRLLIVGEGECRHELEKAAAHRGVSDKVIFAGAVPDPALYYRAMDVFTLSSLTEQMSLSQLEAMASGLACVCTNVGDCAELLGDHSEHQIAPSGNGPVFSAKLRYLGLNPALRRQLGTANRKRCEQTYSLDAMLERYEQLYSSVLAGVGYPLRR